MNLRMLRAQTLIALACAACSGAPANRHTDPARVVEECAQALSAVAGSLDPPTERSCAELFAEEECRVAIARASELGGPVERTAAMARACAAAYCPSFGSPRPYLCDAPTDRMTDEQVAAAWPAVRELALVRDLGPSGGRMAIAFDVFERASSMTVTLPVTSPAGAAADSGNTITVALRPGADGFTLSVLTGGGATDHPIAPDATAAQIAALLPPAEGENGRAIIAADRSASHADFIRIVDALRLAGYTRYAIDVAPD